MNHKDSWTYPVSGHWYQTKYNGIPKQFGKYEIELKDGTRVEWECSDSAHFKIFLTTKAWKLLHKS